MHDTRAGRLLQQRLDVHDRKQLELKIELQPSGQTKRSRYRLELFLHVPGSLYINSETYPREDVYAGVHNYVRLKTPELSLRELLTLEASPLCRLLRWRDGKETLEEDRVVSLAKLVACAVRGALRRFASRARAQQGRGAVTGPCPPRLVREVDEAREGMAEVLRTYRGWAAEIGPRLGEAKSVAALRLVDEYLSLSLEQFFRLAVADMEGMPLTEDWRELRRTLLEAVLAEEAYRKGLRMRSVISTTGDNEEYMHRVGMLKKFCMNALFLGTYRTASRKGYEEALFALAAGLAMMLATGIAAWAQVRFDQLSFSFFFALVVGYMMKDRLKEALRRAFSRVAERHLFDRAFDIYRLSKDADLARAREKVEYLRTSQVPRELALLRHEDELVRDTEGELSETVLRYQRDVVVDVKALPRWVDGPAGVTDILRISVDRLLRDMDEPEFALEYVDAEDYSVGRVRAVKAYRVDLACRFTAEEGERRETTIQVVRLVLDRNGIKRLDRLQSSASTEPMPLPSPVPHVA